MEILKRKCGICKEEKELCKDNFHSDKSRPLGYMYNCRSCEKARTRAKYEKNPRTGRYALMTDEEKAKKYAIGKIYSKTQKGRSIALSFSYLKFDQQRGYDNDITQYDLIVAFASSCVYCGYNATGFDRLDNKKGHTKENCVPCCMECNTARMDNFTHDEMKIIGKAIKTVKENRDKPHFELL